MMCLRVLAALLAVLASVILADEDFGFDISDDLEVEFSSEEPKALWGMPNLSAAVGHVFRLEIPKQAFGDGIQKYEARRHNGKPLPSWLLFDKTQGVFCGVPTTLDVEELHIVVRAIKKSDVISDEFSLTINELQSEQTGPDKCSTYEDSTILTLVIDRDINSIKPKQRVVSINNIAKYFGLPYSAFTLEPQLEPDDITASSVLLAGPGNLHSRNSKSTTAVEVPVGCDGRLWLNTASLVHELKQQARDGTISEVLRLPLIGWRVKTVKHSVLRNKRHERDVDGSGDFDDDQYDYDEYEDYEYSGLDELSPDEVPVAASTPTSTTLSKSQSETSETVTPTDVDNSETHPHRHHHGELIPIDEDSIEFDENTDLGAIPPIVETTTNKTSIEISSETSSRSFPDAFDTTPYHQVTTAKILTETSTTAAPSTTLATTVVYAEKNISKIYNIDDYDYETDYDEYDSNSETEIPSIVTEKILDIHTDTSKQYSVTTESSSTIKIQPETVEFIPETTPSISTSSESLNTTLFVNATTSTSTTTESLTSVKDTLTTQNEIITTYEETQPPTTVITTEVPKISTTLPTTTENLTTLDDITTIKQTTIRHITTTQRPTTRAVTETIEFDVKNFPPTLQNRLKRIGVTAGKVFNFVIPEDTFSDMEDGNNLTLEFLASDGRPVEKSSWCQFSPKKREIFGLPLEEHVSRWTYTVRATDKEGASVTDTLEILVQHHKSRRAVNHEFSFYIQLDKKFEHPYLIDWPLQTLRGMAAFYHHTNLSDIIVRNVDYNSVPVVFTWTNDSLPKHYCPETELDQIFTTLTANSDGDPSTALVKALLPELHVKKVALHRLGVCEQKPPASPVTPPTNFSPILRNPVDHINATIGELLVYKVPEDTFYDPEDVDPRTLKMTLLTANREPIPPDHWLQFDSKNKEFYGIPLPGDAGSKEYQLVCEDSGGLPASDSLVVLVHAPPRRRFNVEFRMTLETPYETFVNSASMQRKFIEKLKELFGDKNTNNIRLSSITQILTTVSWYNTSLNTDVCPRDEIQHLRSILVNSDRTIASRVQYIMDPEFPVSSIQLQEIGICSDTLRPVVQTSDVVIPIDEISPQSSHDEYLITFIVPAVIISIMLLLAGIAACVLYRRRRTGKMNVEEDGRASYGNKGIPVIFQEELDEKPESGTKAPVILKDEKPPLAPPEYSKSGSLKLTDDSEPYQPPPPFTRTQDNGRQSRPKPTPTYRKPPPYVPP